MYFISNMEKRKRRKKIYMQVEGNRKGRRLTTKGETKDTTPPVTTEHNKANADVNEKVKESPEIPKQLGKRKIIKLN